MLMAHEHGADNSAAGTVRVVDAHLGLRRWYIPVSRFTAVACGRRRRPGRGYVRPLSDLVDLIIPGIDGVEFREQEEQPSLRHTLVVCVSRILPPRGRGGHAGLAGGPP
jgi:hypothetical protein